MTGTRSATTLVVWTCGALVALATGGPGFAGECTPAPPARMCLADQSMVFLAARGVVIVEGDGDLLSSAAAAGERRLAWVDREVRVEVCPRAALDAAATCASGAPGWSGTGRLRGSMTTDGDSASCPTILALEATLTAASGEAVSLVLDWAVVPDSAATCRTIERMDFEPGMPIDDPGATVPDLDAEGWQVLDTIMRLEPERWQTLDRLSRVRPEDRAHLESTLEEHGEVWIGDDGEIAPADRAYDALRAGRGRIVTPDGVVDVLNTLVSRMQGVSSRVDSVLARIPDRGDVRSLLDEFDPEVLRDLFATLREDVAGLLAVLRAQKDGFDEFAGPGRSCGTNTPCAVFRADLGRLLDDLGALWIAAQRFRCVDDPGARIVPFRDRLFRTLLTEKAPPIALYFAQRILEGFDGWNTGLRATLDRLPPGLATLCEGSTTAGALTSPDDTCLSSPNKVCCVLRPKGVETGLKLAKADAKGAQLAFKLAEKWTTDDKEATVGATVVAGAAGGTNVKNPGDGALKSAAEIAEKIVDGIEKILEKRKECVEADFDREHDLIDRAAIVPYLLRKDAGGLWEELDELVALRIDTFESAGGDGDAVAQARAHLESARLNPATRGAFDSLCDAYEALTSAP